jgi:hypothetical protein
MFFSAGAAMRSSNGVDTYVQLFEFENWPFINKKKTFNNAIFTTNNNIKMQMELAS